MAGAFENSQNASATVSVFFGLLTLPVNGWTYPTLIFVSALVGAAAGALFGVLLAALIPRESPSVCVE